MGRRQGRATWSCACKGWHHDVSRPSCSFCKVQRPQHLAEVTKGGGKPQKPDGAGKGGPGTQRPAKSLAASSNDPAQPAAPPDAKGPSEQEALDVEIAQLDAFVKSLLASQSQADDKTCLDGIIKDKKAKLDELRKKRAGTLSGAAQLQRSEQRLNRTREQHIKAGHKVTEAVAALEEAQKQLQEAQQRKDELKDKLKEAEDDHTAVLRKLAEEENEEAADEDQALLTKAEGQLASDPAHKDLLQELRMRLRKKAPPQQASRPDAAAPAAGPHDDGIPGPGGSAPDATMDIDVDEVFGGADDLLTKAGISAEVLASVKEPMRKRIVAGIGGDGKRLRYS